MVVPKIRKGMEEPARKMKIVLPPAAEKKLWEMQKCCRFI